MVHFHVLLCVLWPNILTKPRKTRCVHKDVLLVCFWFFLCFVSLCTVVESCPNFFHSRVKLGGSAKNRLFRFWRQKKGQLTLGMKRVPIFFSESGNKDIVYLVLCQNPVMMTCHSSLFCALYLYTTRLLFHCISFKIDHTFCLCHTCN